MASFWRAIHLRAFIAVQVTPSIRAASLAVYPCTSQSKNAARRAGDSALTLLLMTPYMLEVADLGFLVNTGKQLILVDAGSGSWYGGGALGRLAGSLRSAGYTPEE